jgi:hypothetical protein
VLRERRPADFVHCMCGKDRNARQPARQARIRGPRRDLDPIGIEGANADDAGEQGRRAEGLRVRLGQQRKAVNNRLCVKSFAVAEHDAGPKCEAPDGVRYIGPGQGEFRQHGAFGANLRQ